MPDSTPTVSPRQVIFETDDGAALYVDGALSKTGPVAEVIRESLANAGVEVSTATDFLLGHDPKNAREFKAAAAPSIEAIEQYVAVSAQVADLRARAEALEAEAAALEATLAHDVAPKSDPLTDPIDNEPSEDQS